MKDAIIALDIGASKTKLCITSLGYILCEPSFVVLDDKKYFGFEAYQKINEFYPFKNIIENLKICNTEDFEEYIRFILDKCDKQGYTRNFIIPTPNGCSVNNLSEIENCLINCGALKTKFINSAICAYYYLNNGINSSRLIIDIGASKTDITLIKNGTVVSGINLNIGCNNLDNQIIDFCAQNYSIDITASMAENIRINVASLDNLISNQYSFYGMSVNGNKFAKNTINTLDIKSIIDSFYSEIYIALETMLNVCDVEIIEELSETGLDFIGGGSLVKGLNKYFNSKLGLKCNTYSNAIDIIALGLEKLV